MGTKISDEDALDLFKEMRIIDVSEDFLVFKLRHLEVYFDRKTKKYDGIGAYVAQPRQKARNRKKKGR